jgi:hypothetical protein
VEQLKYDSLAKAPALLTNIKLGCKGLQGKIRHSVFSRSVSDAEKKLYKSDTSSNIWHNIQAVTVVISDGLQTTVLPSFNVTNTI